MKGTITKLMRSGFIRTSKTAGHRWLKISRYSQTLTIKHYHDDNSGSVLTWYDSDEDKEFEMFIPREDQDALVSAFSDFFYDLQFERDLKKEA